MKFAGHVIWQVSYLCRVLSAALTAIAFMVVPSVGQSANQTGELPIVVLVRHADKAAQPVDDPPLTEAGAKRAQDLADMAQHRVAGIVAVIVVESLEVVDVERQHADRILVLLGAQQLLKSLRGDASNGVFLEPDRGDFTDRWV